MYHYKTIFIPALLALLLPGCYSSGGEGPTRLTADGSDECNTPMVLQAACQLFRAGSNYIDHAGMKRFVSTGSFEAENYALYQADAITLTSGLGIHLLQGPSFAALAASPQAPPDKNRNGTNLDEVYQEWLQEMTAAAKADTLAGTYPTLVEYYRAEPRYAGEVDLLRHQDDYSSLRWRRDAMFKTVTPETLGRSLYLQLLAAESRLELVRKEYTLQGVKIYHGGIPREGLKGLIAIRAAWEKVRFALDKLAYDGLKLGPVDPDTYDPQKRLLYFPARIRVTEEPSPHAGLPHRIADMEVTERVSTLAGNLALLQGALELFWLSTPGNPLANYRELFDGDPFPASSAPASPAADAAGLIKVILANLEAMHFDAGEGALVERNLEGTPLGTVTTTGAARALRVLAEALEIVPSDPRIEKMLRAQADFLVRRLLDPVDGRAWDGWELGQGRLGSRDNLVTQFAAIDGLLAAYGALDEPAYRARALDLSTLVEREFLIPELDIFRTTRGSGRITWTPAVTAWMAAALRAIAVEGLYPGAADLLGRVQPALFSRLQLLLAEAEATGEALGDGNIDSDGDGIPETTMAGGGHGTAPILAERREFLYTTSPHGGGSEPATVPTVTWSRDIQPFLSKHCSTCHMGGSVSGNLNMSSYESLMRGGSSQALYPIVVPYKANQSLLYLKVVLPTPPVGQQMPWGITPLEPEQTRIIRDWINQGALKN